MRRCRMYTKVYLEQVSEAPAQSNSPEPATDLTTHTTPTAGGAGRKAVKRWAEKEMDVVALARELCWQEDKQWTGLSYYT